MKRYAGLAGGTGIIGYEPEPEAITIQFKNRETYVYDYQRPGRAKVERMKQLAAEGRGLTTFINRYVRKSYARKLSAGHPRRHLPGERPPQR
jgi:hypothetical protein